RVLVFTGSGRAFSAGDDIAAPMTEQGAPAGLVRFAGELVGTPLAERQRALASPLEERLRAERGDEAEMWLALRAHVPQRGELFVSYREDARGRELYRGLQRLRALLCPASLRGMPYDPRAPRAEPRGASAEFLVLELDSGRPPESFGACEELARGPGYRLLRAHVEPPR
ncbi:MAG: hypothetical protein ABL998_21750, partial [Planctomycetota bacterium]